MGLFSKSSYSSFDSNNHPTVNPNPINYKITKFEELKGYLLLEVQYLDCLQVYEGKKIMLFEKCTMKDILRQYKIDPHFSENKDFYSPIARFEPTERGWQNAKLFVESIIIANNLKI